MLAAHDPIACLQRADNMISFHVVKPCHGHVEVLASAAWLQLPDRRAQHSVRGENHCPLDEVSQFPDVSRPSVSHQGLHRFRWDLIDPLVHWPRMQCREVPDQFRNVSRALP